ncbi:MAG: toprim domain-containing protein [Rhizobiaceae bacterium]
MADPISDFIEAMEASGISPIEPIADKLASGNIIRFRAKGDKPGRQNGWARIYLDGMPAGAFGHFRLGIHETWKSGTALCAISSAERRAIIIRARKNVAIRKAESLAKQQAAASVAREHWNDAHAPDPTHAYLKSKGISPFGIRQRGDALLVPMVDRFFRLWSMQSIFPDGRKRFLSGGRTDGLFWPHGAHFADGRPSPGPLIIGEGFATMAAIHIATGYGVIAAMSAFNLEAVAFAMRAQFPDRTLIIAADDDRHLKNNIGLTVAIKAAAAVNGLMATPLPPAGAEPCFTGRGLDFADIPRAQIAALIGSAVVTGASHE